MRTHPFSLELSNKAALLDNFFFTHSHASHHHFSVFTLRQYLFSLIDPYGLTRTLREVSLCRDEAGRAIYSAGNSAVVFRIRHADGEGALRCYLRPNPRLKALYGEQVLEQELFIYETPTTGRWVDVVLTEWREGITLQAAIEEAARAHDAVQLGRLAKAFDQLACQLVADDWAHGGLKPDNLILDPAGQLHLIDFDACYLPSMQGLHAIELGTRAFQHPKRTAQDFNERLDDYPATLITIALHALAMDPSLYDRYGTRDGLLLDPHRLEGDPAYEELLSLFECAGDARLYRMACALRHPLADNPALVGLFQAPEPYNDPTGASLELFAEWGLWGFRCKERVVIPPRYDNGFDFSEGVAAVQVGRRWHFIDPSGRVVLHVPPCEAVKPFRNGRATFLHHGTRQAIDITGRIFDI